MFVLLCSQQRPSSHALCTHEGSTISSHGRRHNKCENLFKTIVYSLSTWHFVLNSTEHQVAGLWGKHILHIYLLAIYTNIITYRSLVHIADFEKDQKDLPGGSGATVLLMKQSHNKEYLANWNPVAINWHWWRERTITTQHMKKDL